VDSLSAATSVLLARTGHEGRPGNVNYTMGGSSDFLSPIVSLTSLTCAAQGEEDTSPLGSIYGAD
jgi:hypothetical protein